MSFNADALRKLAALNLSSEQMAGVVDILADFEAAEEARKLAQRERSARRRALLDVDPREWERLRTMVLNRDGYICTYCHTYTGPFEVDHIVPLSRGGKSTMDNLCVACGPCNAGKRDKTPEEWVGGQ